MASQASQLTCFWPTGKAWCWGQPLLWQHRAAGCTFSGRGCQLDTAEGGETQLVHLPVSGLLERYFLQSSGAKRSNICHTPVCHDIYMACRCAACGIEVEDVMPARHTTVLIVTRQDVLVVVCLQDVPPV